ALGSAHVDPDDRELVDVRHRSEAALDVVGVDVLAVGRDDHVLDAPEDLQPALLVDATDVARVQPALGVDRLAGGAGIGVPDHHVGAARDDLTHAPVVGVVDAQLDARDRLADAGFEARAGPGHGEDRSRLGQAVPLR